MGGGGRTDLARVRCGTVALLGLSQGALEVLQVKWREGSALHMFLGALLQFPPDSRGHTAARVLWEHGRGSSSVFGKKE